MFWTAATEAFENMVLVLQKKIGPAKYINISKDELSNMVCHHLIRERRDLQSIMVLPMTVPTVSTYTLHTLKKIMYMLLKLPDPISIILEKRLRLTFESNSPLHWNIKNSAIEVAMLAAPAPPCGSKKKKHTMKSFVLVYFAAHTYSV